MQPALPPLFPSPSLPPGSQANMLPPGGSSWFCGPRVGEKEGGNTLPKGLRGLLRTPRGPRAGGYFV